MLVFRAPDFVDESSETCKKHAHILGNWFNLIALHARGAPVFLVGTHKDKLTAKQLEDVQRVEQVVFIHIPRQNVFYQCTAIL